MLSQNIHADPCQAFNHWKIHGINVILAKQARCIANERRKQLRDYWKLSSHCRKENRDFNLLVV